MPSNANPLPDAHNASQGTSTRFSRQDHVHPEPTTRIDFSRMPTSFVANRVLRVGAAGSQLVFARVELATDVNGILPIANGGTGQGVAITAADRTFLARKSTNPGTTASGNVGFRGLETDDIPNGAIK